MPFGKGESNQRTKDARVRKRIDDAKIQTKLSKKRKVRSKERALARRVRSANRMVRFFDGAVNNFFCHCSFSAMSYLDLLQCMHTGILRLKSLKSRVKLDISAKEVTARLIDMLLLSIICISSSSILLAT